MKLIITEKPSVARDIAKVLGMKTQGDGFIQGEFGIVTWALGHLIELCQPDAYGELYKQWVLPDLPIIPEIFKRDIIESSKTQYKVVEALCQREDLSEIICATDAGREGELIFRLIYDEAGCKAPVKRLWISSQTDAAIKAGFNELAPGVDYEPLYDSARSRSEADWIVGINATRAYSIKFSRGHGVLSVGRVQTPVLKMIVDRYREHKAFQSKTFYEVFADLVHENGSFTVKYFNELTDRFEDKQTADALKQDLDAIKQGVVQALTEKEMKEKQPLLYDLTEIQKDANKQFKFSADQTLKLMQSLYEKHKILSYPRTSSRYISQDVAKTLPSLLKTIAGLSEFSAELKEIETQKWAIASRMVDDKKVTDHHAIIPTDKKPNVSALSENEKMVYLLVIRRFLAAFFPLCEKHHTEIIVSFKSHLLKATGTVIKVLGWRTLYQRDFDLDSKKKDKEACLPVVQKGDVVNLEKSWVKKGQTKAPALYTEASILGAMETAGKQVEDEEMRQAMKECGLGTPATRAQILEKLIHVKYIVREKQKLVPTDKGEYLIDCILDDALLSPELTGLWEKQLNDMAESKVARESFMDEIKSFTHDMVGKVADSQTVVLRSDQEILGPCPLCEPGKIIEGKKGFGCTHWKDLGCKFVIWKEIAKKAISVKMAKSLLKDGKTAVLKGFKNKAGNPFDAALTLKEGSVVFDFDRPSLGTCPVCEKGQVVETNKAFSCNQWRETGCKFAIWKEIAKRKITVLEAKVLLDQGELEKLSGFKSKAGKEFSAALTLKQGKVEFLMGV